MAGVWCFVKMVTLLLLVWYTTFYLYVEKYSLQLCLHVSHEIAVLLEIMQINDEI